MAAACLPPFSILSLPFIASHSFSTIGTTKADDVLLRSS